MDKSNEIIRVGVSEVREFKKSQLAKDMKRELLIWRRVAKQGYSDCKTLLEKGRIDGRVEAIESILAIPDVFEEYLEQIRLEKEEEKDGIRCDETD